MAAPNVDVRTIVRTLPQYRLTSPAEEAVVEMPHHPLSDCRIQIRDLCKHGQDLAL